MARDLSGDGLVELAERIRSRVASHVFEIGEGRVVRTTCSVGFACYPFFREQLDALSWEQVISVADRALYVAKASGRNAWVEGVGEQLKPVELPPGRFVVVKPPQGLSTALVFSDAQLKQSTDAAIISGFAARPGQGERDFGKDPFGFGRNDLQPAAQRLCPSVTEALEWLGSRGLAGRMTGSGSAVFAQMSQDKALQAAGRRGNAEIWRLILWWDGHPATIHRWAAENQPPTCVGESPSWLRHWILIPACEGSSPSSPAKFSWGQKPRKNWVLTPISLF